MMIVVLFYISLFFGVLLHELGHSLAVWWVGHRLTEFSIGPLCIRNASGKYKLSLRKNIFTGLVRYERQHLKTSWSSEVLIICSGVIANILGGIISIGYYVYFSNNGLFVIFGTVSLALGLMNLVPAKNKNMGLDSDAKRFIDMLAFAKHVRNMENNDTDLSPNAICMKAIEDAGSNPARIEFLNDDATPMEYVVKILKFNFPMDDFAAVVLMHAIHSNGKAGLGWVDIKIAGDCVNRINLQARSDGYPFSCRVVV